MISDVTNPTQSASPSVGSPPTISYTLSCSFFFNHPNSILHVEDLIVSPAGRDVNLLVKKDTILCSTLDREIGPYQSNNLLEICTSSAVYVQYLGYDHSNGAYDFITVDNNHYNIKS